ncbi:HAD family hydrolase [Lentilactobacillus sp. Marseille-Q4993]|uniref:HAD family hydrolase n=1 Tax=Lentilactobacillus sp. Marseille-Q4993 TaxID=3039492 RepID=UPI0024BC2D36|nr:HAD family hydrolase [Lentilactobacillus sp. Marseille-Q4993]
MEAYIFDVDGTLIDTETMYLKPLSQVLANNGYQVSKDELNAVFGITAIDALKRLGVTDPQKIKDEWFSKVPDFRDTVTVFDGIEDALAELSKTKKVAVATSKASDEFKRDVTPFGLDKYFSEFVFLDDVEYGKPAPDPVLKGIEKLGSRAEMTVYVGDTEYDLQAAHAAGSKFALAGWQTPMNPKFSATDFYLKEPADLLKI